MKRLWPIIFCLFVAPPLAAQQVQTSADSLLTHVVNYLLPGHNQLLRSLPYYDCVHYDRAGLRFPGGREAQDRFCERLDSLLLFHSRGIRVWHVGGSHVQADFFSHRMRTNLSSMQPGNMAARGVLFPFAMASTNYNHNYSCSYTGQWTSGRIVQRGAEESYAFGLTGIAATTVDTLVSLTLVTNVGQTPSWQYDRLRVLGYFDGAQDGDAVCSSDGYEGRIYAVENGDTLLAEVDSVTMSYVLCLGEMKDSTTFFVRLPQGNRFTLTGLLPENDLVGVTYFSSGINGASLSSWLRCRNLERDLQLARPDLVVLGIGINDANVPQDEFSVESFKSAYRSLIRQVEAVSPGCAYVFITNNDTYRRVSRRVKRPNPNAVAVQRAMTELAAEYGGAVWDVFDMMGGLDSSPSWRSAGLMANDLIHFTRTGYELLGDMLYNAIIEYYMSTSSKR